MRLKQKLVLSFVLIALLASVSGMINLYAARGINAQYADALVNYGFSQGDISRMMTNFVQTDGYLHDAVNGIQRENRKTAEMNMKTYMERMPQYFEKVEASIGTEEERQLFAAIQQGWENYEAQAKKLTERADTENPEVLTEIQGTLLENSDPFYQMVYQDIEKLLELNNKIGTQRIQELASHSSNAVLLAWIISITVLAVSVILGILVASSVAKPIEASTKRLSDLVTKGDLSSPAAEGKAKGELGILEGTVKKLVRGLQEIIADEDYLLREMAKGNFNVHSGMAEKYVGDFSSILVSMRGIADSLSETLSRIHMSAEEISGSAQQVSSGAQALSEGAAEQASAVEELASEITSISEQISSNAEYAEQVNHLAGNVTKGLLNSKEEMRGMIEAMRDINTRSEEIVKIIRTIEDIAFQTNILALNATVEAARAGASGKGFAVVAGEVRNLAAKSAEASQNTAILIDDSITAVKKGVKITENMAKTLLSAVEEAQTAAGMIDKISAANKEQADSVAQITIGVEQISGVVQTNSATSEESAAASEELFGQSQILKELVGQFQFREK